MKFYEKVVTETWDCVAEIQKATSGNAGDYEAVLGLYAQLRDASDCQQKLYLLSLNYLEKSGLPEKSD